MSSTERTGRHAAAAAPARRRAQGALVLRRAGTVVAVLLLLLVAAVLAAVAVVPRVVGAQPLVVLTGSMAPQIPAGSVVVVRPVDARTLHVGDVVTYEVADGGGALVTHRVVEVGHDDAGSVELTTRGDANVDADLDPVPASAVRGEVWYHLPYVGYATDLLRGSVGGVSERVLAAFVAGGALALYAAVQVLGAVGERRRARAATTASWSGRTASRELMVATLQVDGGNVDVDALDRLVEDLSATVLATTDTTVSVAVTAPPAVLDEAVGLLGALAPVHVQRTGALLAPLGPGSPQLTTGRRRPGRARDVA